MRKHNESILSRRTTSALSSILLAATVMLAGVGVIPTLATPRASAQTPTISWSVRAYANNARVLPPLIGDFQLGTATFEGNGTFSVSGAADGSIADRDVPLISRYRSSSLAVRALSGTFSESDGTRRLDLRVRITGVSGSPKGQCLVGSTAIVTLIDSDDLLENGELADFAGIGSFSKRCGHVHGWSNEDRDGTEPTFGGPGGGNRADVRIDSFPQQATSVPPTAPPTSAPQQTAPPTTVAAVGATCAGFTGTFKTDYDEMRLVNGNGVYDYLGRSASQITNATVTQTAAGWTLVGRWVQINGTGNVTFFLDMQGKLTGKWGYGDTPVSSPWSGRCVSG